MQDIQTGRGSDEPRPDLPASLELKLNRIKLRLRDNRLVMILHIVLGNLPIVLYLLPSKEIGCVLLLEQGITLVLLVREDALDALRIPFLIARGCCPPLCLQLLADGGKR